MKSNDTTSLEGSDTPGEENAKQAASRTTKQESRRTEAQRPTQIPSLLTNSLRVVFDAFGEQIIQLRARGSIETTNSTLLDDLREFGLTWEQHDSQRLVLNYEQLPGADPENPVNELTDDVRQTLLEEVGARLGPTTTGVDPDLAVTSLTVRVTDERLESVTPAHTDEFDICFVSDPAESAIRDITKRRNIERGLYDALGFEVRNLNVRTVVETATKHHQQSDGRYLSWGGPGDTRPRSPDRLAVRINDHVLPDEYGILKPYTVTEDNTLELADEVLDQAAEATPFVQNDDTTDSDSGGEGQ